MRVARELQPKMGILGVKTGSSSIHRFDALDEITDEALVHEHWSVATCRGNVIRGRMSHARAEKLCGALWHAPVIEHERRGRALLLDQ